MIRTALPLSLVAALGLAACGTDPNNMSSREPQPRASVAHAQPSAYRPGNGVVQSITPAPRMASAGGTAPATTTRNEPVASAGSPTGATAVAMQRLAIRMEDGRVQYVDMPSGQDVPPVGSRVQLTADHQIIRQQ